MPNLNVFKLQSGQFATEPRLMESFHVDADTLKTEYFHLIFTKIRKSHVDPQIQIKK